MRSKILKAIQEGIKQSFMIDSESEDEEFVKSKISSGLSAKHFQDQFEKLCQDVNQIRKAVAYFKKWEGVLDPLKIENEETLQKYAKNFFDETFTNNIEGDSLVSIEEIVNVPNDYFYKAFDISEFLIYIDSNDNEIKIHEYCQQNYNNTSNIVFVKLSTNVLKNTDNEILFAVHNNHYISGNTMVWCKSSNNSLNKNIKDCEGYLNTIFYHKQYSLYNAIEYCLRQKIKIGNSTYQGYCPAIGQFDIMYAYHSILYNAFKLAGAKGMDPDVNDFWSSSEKSDNVWHFGWGFTDYECMSDGYKNETRYAFPMFKKVS